MKTGAPPERGGAAPETLAGAMHAGDADDDQGVRRLSMRGKGMDQTLRLHDLRHTYASHYLREGGRIFRRSRYLGHSSVKITERVCAT